jgi:hypothetical protein
MADLAASASALQWSVTAMAEAAGRLARVAVWDRARAFAVIGESVWWVTIVDATLVRHHPGMYDAVLAGQGASGRQVVEGTLTGLRFVRNRIAREAAVGGLIEPGAAGPGGGGVTGWRWRPVPEPALGSLSPRGRAWELARYRAYQAQLAGHTIGETFGRAAPFLTLAATSATAIAYASPQGQPGWSGPRS